MHPKEDLQLDAVTFTSVPRQIKGSRVMGIYLRERTLIAWHVGKYVKSCRKKYTHYRAHNVQNVQEHSLQQNRTGNFQKTYTSI